MPNCVDIPSLKQEAEQVSAKMSWRDGAMRAPHSNGSCINVRRGADQLNGAEDDEAEK